MDNLPGKAHPISGAIILSKKTLIIIDCSQTSIKFPCYYPCQIWGGPPQNVDILGRALISRGCDVRVLTTNIFDEKRKLSKLSYEAEWNGVPVTYLNTHWLGKQPNSTGFIIAPDLWHYRNLIPSADLLHIHGYRHFLFTGTILLARLYKIPYILHARGVMAQAYGRTYLKVIYDSTIGRFLAKGASAAIALSDKEIKEYLHLGVDRTRIFKIMNPIDASVCSQLPDRNDFRRRYNIHATTKMILFLSRLHERKGLGLLIEAFASLEDVNSRLVIVGPDAGYKKRAEELVVKNHLDERVIFTGPLTGCDKYAAFRAADVYVLPTQGGEGFPTTIGEAIYAGVPIIVTDRTEAAKLIDGTVGLSVPYDAQSLANAITKIISFPASIPDYKANSQRLLREQFDLDSIINQTMNVYEFVAIHTKR